MRIQDIRKMFPALSQTVYGKPLVYFDNAATAQRPESVVRQMESLALGTNANIHRAVHKLAADATAELFLLEHLDRVELVLPFLVHVQVMLRRRLLKHLLLLRRQPAADADVLPAAWSHFLSARFSSAKEMR